MSFLDVICCGFGAIILLLMLSKSFESQVTSITSEKLQAQLQQREQPRQPRHENFAFSPVATVIVSLPRTKPPRFRRWGTMWHQNPSPAGPLKKFGIAGLIDDVHKHRVVVG